MENCPPEILSRIFVLACADGGHMGGVLRLVSKRIATQAKPFRFWSVCVNGVDRLERFEKTILKVGAAQRRVQYLFISDKTGYLFNSDGQQISRGFGTTEEDNLSNREDLYSGYHRLTIAQRSQRTAYHQEAKKFTQVFARLLGHLRTHLKSLTLLLYNIQCTRWMEDLRSRTFPRMIYMWLYCKSYGATIPSDLCGMPALRSLTIGPYGSIWWSCISLFMSSCNSLERITLEGLVCDTETPAAVRQILNSKNDSSYDSHPEHASQLTAPSSFHLRISNATVTSLLPIDISKETLFRDIVKAGAQLIPRTVKNGTRQNGPTYYHLKLQWKGILAREAMKFAIA